MSNVNHGAAVRGRIALLKKLSTTKDSVRDTSTKRQCFLVFVIYGSQFGYLWLTIPTRQLEILPRLYIVQDR